MRTSIRAALGALFTGAFGAWLFRANLTTDDTGIVAGLILLGSAVAAWILPPRWWPMAAGIPLCVLLSEIYRRETKLDPGFLLVALVIAAFSFAGIATAVATRRLINDR